MKSLFDKKYFRSIKLLVYRYGISSRIKNQIVLVNLISILFSLSAVIFGVNYANIYFNNYHGNNILQDLLIMEKYYGLLSQLIIQTIFSVLYYFKVSTKK